MGGDRRVVNAGALLLVAITWSACRRASDTHDEPGPTASTSAKPVDHLAPGELAPGKDEAFGLPLPRGMEVKARFPGKVHARGKLAPEDVANYVRERVIVRYVELGAAATIFPRVTIKNGPKDRLFTIEVERAPGGTTLIISDSTPLPKPPVEMTEAQLMQRAGLTPDGKVKNLKDLE